MIDTGNDQLQQIRSDSPALRLRLMKAALVIGAGAGSRVEKDHGQNLVRFAVGLQLCRSGNEWMEDPVPANRLMVASGTIPALRDRKTSEGLVGRRPGARYGRPIRTSAEGRPRFDDMPRNHVARVRAMRARLAEEETVISRQRLIRIRCPCEEQETP